MNKILRGRALHGIHRAHYHSMLYDCIFLLVMHHTGIGSLIIFSCSSSPGSVEGLQRSSEKVFNLWVVRLDHPVPAISGLRRIVCEAPRTIILSSHLHTHGTVERISLGPPIAGGGEITWMLQYTSRATPRHFRVKVLYILYQCLSATYYRRACSSFQLARVTVIDPRFKGLPLPTVHINLRQPSQ